MLQTHLMLPFFVTVPHSGEKVPAEVEWLKGLSEPHLMRDVDRYVDQLYAPIIEELEIPHIISQWHRYVVDLNRKSDEYDENAVEGAPHPVGAHPKGLHWSVTTINEPLITQPMTAELHQQLLNKYYEPFHKQVTELATRLRSPSAPNVFHLDLHSMPSVGTNLHPDPGERRADIVVSDYHGKSSRSDFVDLVKKAYQDVGFNVAYNWPYVGGGVTQRYGKPEKGHHTVQVELNRDLYMDEETKKPKEDEYAATQLRLCRAIETIYGELVHLLSN